MRDAQIVLRFFALRHVDKYQYGMKRFLDLYMVRARSFTDPDIEHLRTLFESTVALGWNIYEELFAKPWDIVRAQWAPRPQVAFSDAVMVGISRHLDHSSILVSARDAIINDTRSLFEQNAPGTFAGRANTKKDVQDRIRLYEQMLQRHLDQ